MSQLRKNASLMMASELTLTLQFWESLFEILESRGFIKNYMYASGVKCYPGHPWAVKLDPRKDIFLPWQTNDCLLQFLISLINILNRKQARTKDTFWQRCTLIFLGDRTNYKADILEKLQIYFVSTFLK
jgi:hypothetical protein